MGEGVYKAPRLGRRSRAGRRRSAGGTSPRLHELPPSLNKNGGTWGWYVQSGQSPTDANPRRRMGGYVTHRPPMTAADGGGTSGASYGRGSRRRCLTEGSIAYSERAWSISPLRVRHAGVSAIGLTSSSFKHFAFRLRILKERGPFPPSGFAMPELLQ